MFDTMRPTHVVWALSAALLAACTNGANETHAIAAADVTASEEALRKPQVEWQAFEDPQGTDAAGSKPMARLIRSESGYRRLFGHSSPGIDFAQDVVVFYSAGEKSTGGYRADITAIEKHGQRLTVTTQLTSPGADCVVTQALTIPSVLVRVHGAGYVRKARFEHTEQTSDCRATTPCGGIAGIECPGMGTCDQDDPSDDCDPEHGADCRMLCSCNVRALCIRGLVFDPSPAVCACVPDPNAVACGGFASDQCPGLGSCVDDPQDDCDPDAGGADCSGHCECSALAKCQADDVFDASPQVCACVKPVEDPCALVDCRSGAVCTVSDGKPICVSNGNWQCGKNLCPAGQQCCNESCGICAPPGGACTQQACEP